MAEIRKHKQGNSAIAQAIERAMGAQVRPTTPGAPPEPTRRPQPQQPAHPATSSFGTATSSFSTATSSFSGSSFGVPGGVTGPAAGNGTTSNPTPRTTGWTSVPVDRLTSMQRSAAADAADDPQTPPDGAGPQG